MEGRGVKVVGIPHPTQTHQREAPIVTLTPNYYS